MKDHLQRIIKLSGALIGISLMSACTLLNTEPAQVEPRATGDLGVIIERVSGSVQIVNTSELQTITRLKGLGDLSHASIVYSRDQRYAYVFGRDGGLSKIDLLQDRLDKRVMQSGNSIGGAISQDGRLVAVSNYEPGGVKVFDSTTLELVADIPASAITDPRTGKQKGSKVVGLVDAPGHKFVFSLFDSNEIWVADFSDKTKAEPQLSKFTHIGKQPYDALITPDGRYYIAGLFGEDGMALLDLWHLEKGVQRILPDYGKGEQALPVYKMPHLEGWAVAGNLAFVPAVGRHRVLVIDMQSWQQLDSIEVHGQPVFVMARPDGRQIWVNFAYPNNDTLQIIDAQSRQLAHTLKPGIGVLHMEFSPRGEHLWASVRDLNQVHVYDTLSLDLLKVIDVQSPSGIFFTARAHKIGL